MIVALDAAASCTSLWVMPPTPRCTNASFTSSRSSLLEALGERLERAGDVGLEDEVERGRSPRLDLLEDVLEPGAADGDARPRGRGGATRCQCSRVSATLRAVFSSGATTKSSPASATSERPSTCTGVDGPASLTCSPWSSMSARTRPQAGAGDERVADLERAALHEHGGHRAAADVEVRLEHHAARRGRRGWPRGPRRRRRASRVSSRSSMPSPVERRHLDHLGVAAPVLRDEALLGELLHHPVGVGLLAVDLVDGDDDRHLGRLGVVERLDRLGHHAVVGRHHQHDDVGGLGAAGPHGGERLVARGVDEGDAAGRS